jgi:hypothetical protein
VKNVTGEELERHRRQAATSFTPTASAPTIATETLIAYFGSEGVFAYDFAGTQL